MSRLVSVLESRTERATGFRPMPLAYESTGASQFVVVIGDPSTLSTLYDFADLINRLVPSVPKGGPGFSLVRHFRHTDEFGVVTKELLVREANGTLVGPAEYAKNEEVPRIESRELLNTADRLVFIREQLSLNISQLSEVLGVSRPALYKWLKDETKPQHAQRMRIFFLYNVAKFWRKLSETPLKNRYLITPLEAGLSLLELLKNPSVNETSIHIAMRMLSERGSSSDRAEVGVAALISDWNSGNTGPAFEVPSDETQRLRLKAAARRGNWNR